MSQWKIWILACLDEKKVTSLQDQVYQRVSNNIHYALQKDQTPSLPEDQTKAYLKDQTPSLPLVTSIEDRNVTWSEASNMTSIEIR